MSEFIGREEGLRRLARAVLNRAGQDAEKGQGGMRSSARTWLRSELADDYATFAEMNLGRILKRLGVSA